MKFILHHMRSQFLTCFFGVMAGCSCYAQDIHFFALSDIHFDPFYDCPLSLDALVQNCPLFEALQTSEVSQWRSIFLSQSTTQDAALGEDTNFALLENILVNKPNNLKSIIAASHAVFGVYLGDTLAHNMQKKYTKFNPKGSEGYSQFVAKTMAFVAQEIAMTAPSLPIYPVLGNNDSDLGDYIPPASGADFYRTTAQAWTSFFPQAAALQFAYSGYYPANTPIQNIKIVALNTSFMSKHVSGNEAQVAQQLEWLKNQLEAAKESHQKVLFLEHIPYGISTYSHESAWQSNTQLQMIQLAQQYSDVFIAQLSGHEHNHGFYATSYPNLLVSSVSPQHGNDPEFEIFSIDNQDFSLKDRDVFLYKLDTNQHENVFEYNFDTAYHAKNIQQGIGYFQTESQLQNFYLSVYAPGQEFSVDEDQKIICAALNISLDHYNMCNQLP